MDWRLPRVSLAVLACLLVVGSVRAESFPAQSKILNPKSGIAAPFLWKITPQGGGAPSWLFGTIHLQRPEVAVLAPAVKDALDHADAAYTEIPFNPETILAISSSMMLGTRSLDKILGSKLAADFTKELKTINPALTSQPFEHFKPWAAAAALLELEDQMKYPGTMALDMIIFQRAAAAGKEVGGLETPAEQLAVFDDFNEAEQVSMVRDTIQQLRSIRGSGKSPSDLLARLYLAGDLDTLVSELNKIDAAGNDPALNEKFMDRLLYRRNAIMAERILEKLHAHPEKSYFFAVGAAHLQGNRGLLAALTKAGFRLTRAESY